MTAAEFTLRVINALPLERERIEKLNEFFKLYDVTEKKALALSPEQQSQHQGQMLGHLPPGAQLH